jgi:hypothetical protein
MPASAGSLAGTVLESKTGKLRRLLAFKSKR